MTITAEMSEAQRLRWDACAFQAKTGEIRPMVNFLREMNARVEGVDLARLADVMEAKKERAVKRKSRLKRGRPSPTNDVYVLAERNRVEPLAELLRKAGIYGDVPDLWAIADWLEARPTKGAPPKPKLLSAVSYQNHGSSVEALTDAGYSFAEALATVAAESSCSIDIVRRDLTRWRKAKKLRT